jgi:hypothetical protein
MITAARQQRGTPDMTVPAGLEFKTAGTVTPEIPPALAGPKHEGIVTAIVAVTGVKDDVDDVIIPGAFKRTLAERRPKVCLGHDWNRPIGKTLDIKELMPGDPGLPKTTGDGRPWPAEAGAVLARSQYNMDTEDGRKAFQDAMFFGGSECYQSIGYRVPPEGKKFKGGVRYISDLDLFEYGPVLHPANRLATIQSTKDDATDREDNAIKPDEVKARKYVKDSSYWGLPVGTLITPGMKPRGRTALAERRQGKTPDRNAGVATEPPADGKKPRSVAHKPEKAKEERDAAGLFPEPDAPEGARVKPSDPAGLDAEHVQALVENEASDKDHVARDEAIIGLIGEGITPAELEEDMHASEHWPEDMSEEDRQAAIDDVVNDYRRQYRREAARQASDTGQREQHPEDDNLAVEKEEADGAAKPEPEPDAKRDITTLTPEELDKYMEAARKGSLSNVGDKQRRFQDVYAKAQAEKLRREDAARRSVPAHPLDPKAYEQANRAVEKRRNRAADVQKRNQTINKTNADIDSSEAAAANAPETMAKLPPKTTGQKVSKAANGRVGFRGKGTANWAIVSSDGRAVVTPANFTGEGRGNVKLSGPQLDELADRIAGITNSKGDRAPFTDPNSEGWVPGFRDSDGRSLEQAVAKVVADFAGERGLKVGTRTDIGLRSTPWGHKQGPAGEVNAEGFHPQERIQDLGPGDTIKLRNGDVKTVKAVTEDNGPRRDRYGVDVFEIEFDDGSKEKFSQGQRFDTKYAEENNPDAEGRLNDPGMGYTSNSNLGRKRVAGSAALGQGRDDVPAGTRFIYTPDRADGDNRPRIGTVTDRVTTMDGREFQVVEYDDGTFDGVNVAKLAADGKINLKPTPEQEADARTQWGVGDGATETGSDLGEGDSGTGDLATSDGGTPEGESTASAEGGEPPAPADDEAARVAKLKDENNPDRTPIAGLANQLTGQAKPDVSGISTEDLSALDQEFARRADLLGKPGQETRAHQAVKAELATRTDAGAEPAPEPDGGLGENEAVISRAEVDDAQRTADEILGVTEGPDGELEADPDVADRQDRVETLLEQAQSGALDLESASDDVVTGQRRELVEELRFQNAVARRDRKQRQITRTEDEQAAGGQQDTGEDTGAEGGAPDGGDGGPAPEPTPKARPGVAGAAEDLADALDDGDQQAAAAAMARLESSVRRSRSDSEHLGPLREAIAGEGGIQAALDAGTITPATLREFAKNLRDERRQQANTRARDRRTVKRLERERLRGLIGAYDTELRRRNLKPEDFGGDVPAIDDGDGRPEVTGTDAGLPDGTEAGQLDVSNDQPTGPSAERAGRLIAEPWRIVNSDDAAMNGSDATSTATRQAATAAFADVADKYSSVLRDATPEQLAAAEAKLDKRGADVRSEAMVIALLLPRGATRDAFMTDMRTAMGNYQTNLAALQARADRGEVNLDPAPELGSIAPNRVGWGGRLNALAPRQRADRPAGTPPFSTVSQVKANLKSLTPPPGASDFDQKTFTEGRDQLVREIDAAGNDVFLSPGGGLLAFRATTRDGKRWFLIHTQTGQSIPSLFVFDGRRRNDLTPATGRGVDPQRYDLDGPAMRRLMTAFETMQDPRGRQVDFTEPDPDRFAQSLIGWRDFSADGSVRPAFVDGQPRYQDSMEGAAILEAVRDDMRRYGTTSAVHRATQMVSNNTQYTGVNGRSPQQYRQLMNEQFSFALQDFNYGRKRVRGQGPSEDRTAEQLKSDKDTAAAIDQARALIQTGNPAEAVSVLRARAAELKDTDAERGPRFGSARLERLADGTADLFSPAQSDMDRLIGAQDNDVIAVPTRDDEPPMLYRITSAPQLVLTRNDGTRTYQFTVTSNQNGDQDAVIDTASQYGVMIGDQYGDRYGNNQATNLGQSSIGQWSVYRAEENQGAPADNAQILRDSRRTIREFDRAAGLDNGEDDGGGDQGGGGGGPDRGPDGGPDETGGERPVAAEGKAITVDQAKIGDLVAIPSGEGRPPFVGHVLGRNELADTRALLVLGPEGDTRTYPLDANGVIHRIELTDQDVLDRLPDFDTSPRVTVGEAYDVFPLLADGTPVRISTGVGDEYRPLAAGVITVGPDGPMLRTGDGRLLSANALIDDKNVHFARVEMVADPGDYTGEDDKYVNTPKTVKVDAGDRVQAFVEMEDPTAEGGVRTRWANGWVENVDRTEAGEPLSALVRLPSGAAVKVRFTDGQTNRLRRKGNPTKRTLAAVNATGPTGRSTYDTDPQLSGGVAAVSMSTMLVALNALDGSDARVDLDDTPSERLRALADLIEHDTADLAPNGGGTLYHNEIPVSPRMIRFFAGLPASNSLRGDESYSDASREAAVEFSRAFAVRSLRSAADSIAQFEEIDEPDPAKRKERLENVLRTTMKSRSLANRAVADITAAYGEAIAKAGEANAEDDNAPAAILRRRVGEGAARATQKTFDNAVLAMVNSGQTDLSPVQIRIVVDRTMDDPGIGRHLAEFNDATAGDADAAKKLRSAIAEVVAKDVLEAQQGGKLKAEWDTIIQERSTGDIAPAPAVRPEVAGVVASELERADVLSKVDSSKPYTERVAALKAQLPAKGQIGKRSSTVYRLTGDVLDGKLELTADKVFADDIDARDGGPGREAMRHLAVLRAIGQEVQAEARRRIEAKVAEDSDSQFRRRRLDEIKAELAALPTEPELKARIDAALLAEAEQEDGSFTTSQLGAMRVALLRGFGAVEKFAGDRSYGKAGARMTAVAKRAQEKLRPEITAARKIRDQREELLDSRRRIKAAQDKFEAPLLAEARREALAGVRDLGKPGDAKFDLGTTSTMTEEKTKGYMDWVAQHYPAEWLPQAGRVTVTQQTNRGFYSDPEDRIEVSNTYDQPRFQDAVGGAYGQVFIHEYGHRMEAKIPGILRAEWLLHWDRTSTGAIGSREREEARWMGDLMPAGAAYGRDEVAMPDEFAHPYSGKVYSDSPDAHAWELFTMGMESLFAGSTHLDNDYENWTLGVLAGV